MSSEVDFFCKHGLPYLRSSKLIGIDLSKISEPIKVLIWLLGVPNLDLYIHAKFNLIPINLNTLNAHRHRFDQNARAQQGFELAGVPNLDFFT